MGRPVIKVWNNVLAKTLAEKGLPAGSKGSIALSIAGDDLAAKKIVMSLVEDTGFDAIDAGSLSESLRQPGTSAYCAEQTDEELRSALARADRLRATGQGQNHERTFSIKRQRNIRRRCAV